MSKGPLTYQDAGVNIDAGNALVDRIKQVARRTQRPGVLGGLGGFGALFELPTGYREPVLVSGTDGVGTKLRLAMDLDRHDQIGIDLVAMCVNDLVVAGAEPLFFLDYYATGTLDVDVASSVVTGIGAGCEQAGCALVGGETAEMPGMYTGNDYDLAGFCVGIAEKSELITGERVAAGDVILGLASSGPHSNGYSLIRKIVDRAGVRTTDALPSLGGQTLADALLAPTRIYVRPLLSLIRSQPVHALSHITGGGFTENIPRVLPAGLQASINPNAWKRPAIFNWLQEQGEVATAEMFRTFNCGVGMVLVVPASSADAAMAHLAEAGETVYRLGEIREREDGAPAVAFDGAAA